jgi:hypothetical protein
VLTASVNSGLPIGEAHLLEKAIERGEETNPFAIPAAGPAATQQEGTMPKANGDQVEELKTPDFEQAVRIFRSDIKPANEKSGEHAQEASTAYKKIKDLGVSTRAAKFIFKLAGESEEKRNDVLRSVRGLLEAMNIGITDDLVSEAEGENTAAPIVPTAKPENTELATLQ